MSAAAPSEVHLQLPDGWIEFDPRAPDPLAAVLAAAALPPDAVPTAAALLTPLVSRLSRLSAAADIVLAGCFAQQVPVPGRERPLLVSAQLLLSMSPPIGDATQLRELLGGDDVEVAPIELPAGPGVVVSGLTEVDDPVWDRPQPVRLRRYFVPVAGLSRVAALAFTTPNVDLSDEFDELFDAIAGTLSFS